MNEEEINKLFKDNPIKTIKCGDIEVPVEYLKQTAVTINGDDYIRLQKENKQLKEKLDIENINYKTLSADIGTVAEYMKLDEYAIIEEMIDRAIEYIEYNNETLYTYEPDYDYEENIVSNYDVSSFREDLLEILKGEPNDKTNKENN